MNKNFRIVALFLISCLHIHIITSSQLGIDPVLVHCAQSMSASKALQQIAEKASQEPAGKVSHVLRWLNPTSSMATSTYDDHSLARKDLQAIEDAADLYYQNSGFWKKSTGNQAQRDKAQEKFAQLVIKYQQKLDEGDEDYQKYQGQFQNILEEISESNPKLLPDATNTKENIFASLAQALANLIPSQSKGEEPASAAAENEEDASEPAGYVSAFLRALNPTTWSAGTSAQHQHDSDLGYDQAYGDEAQSDVKMDAQFKQDTPVTAQQQLNAMRQFLQTNKTKIENLHKDHVRALEDSDKPYAKQLEEEKDKLAQQFIGMLKTYINSYGQLNQQQGVMNNHTSITAKGDATKPIILDKELRKIVDNGNDIFEGYNLTIDLGRNGYKASLERLWDDIKDSNELQSKNS